jgi:NitT/TauT family transport system substrate-binding protein
MRLTRAGVALIVFLLIACPIASIVSYAALTRSALGPLNFGAATATPERRATAIQAAGPTPTARQTVRATTAAQSTAASTQSAGGTTVAGATATAGGQPKPSQAATSPATAAIAPGSPTTAAGGQTVTVAYDAYVPYFPVRIADVQGYYKAQNVQVKQVPFDLNGNSYDENQRRQALRDGTFDVLLTTLDAAALFNDDQTGKIVAIVDESAGADKIVARAPIARLNDLKGKRIAFSGGSVSEFFLYANLGLVGLKPGDVQLQPKEGVDDAVKAFTDGQADAVVGWEPNIDDAMKSQGAKVLIGSDNFRAILDVMVVSTKALNEKPAAIQAFVNAWFQAVKLTTDDPQAAGAAVVKSGDTDWSGVAQPSDFVDGLKLVAQATLGQNAFALRDASTVADRIGEAQNLWRSAGKQIGNVDPAKLVDTRFVQQAASQSNLDSTKPPVNSSFVLTSKIAAPQLTPEQLGQTQAVAELPLKQIDFAPDSAVLTDQGRKDLMEQIVPVLKRTPGLYLRVDGSAAWPAGDTAQANEDFARQRAQAVIYFLISQGVDSNRLIPGYIKPQFPNSTDENQMKQDRRVVFTLVQPGGR